MKCCVPTAKRESISNPPTRQQHSAPLKETGYTEPARLEMLPEMLAQSEWELLRYIDVYPRRLAKAAAQLAPNVLAAYAFELASHFTDFYEHTSPIVREADERVKAFCTHLVRATVQTMSNVLRVLGFVTHEEFIPQILLSTA